MALAMVWGMEYGVFYGGKPILGCHHSYTLSYPVLIETPYISLPLSHPHNCSVLLEYAANHTEVLSDLVCKAILHSPIPSQEPTQASVPVFHVMVPVKPAKQVVQSG